MQLRLQFLIKGHVVVLRWTDNTTFFLSELYLRSQKLVINVSLYLNLFFSDETPFPCILDVSEKTEAYKSLV